MSEKFFTFFGSQQMKIELCRKKILQDFFVIVVWEISVLIKKTFKMIFYRLEMDIS